MQEVATDCMSAVAKHRSVGGYITSTTVMLLTLLFFYVFNIDRLGAVRFAEKERVPLPGSVCCLKSRRGEDRLDCDAKALMSTEGNLSTDFHWL